MPAVPSSLPSLQRKNAEKLFDQLGIVDLFEISQLSPRSFNWVKNYFADNEFQEEVCLYVNMSSTISLSVIFEDEQIDWWFYGRRDPKRYELEDMVQRTDAISGMGLAFGELEPGVYACSTICIPSILKFVECLSSLFNISVRLLKVDSAQYDNLKVLQSIEILRKSTTLMIVGGSLKHEELRGVLDGFEPYRIMITCGTEPGFVYDGTVTARRFRAFNASWFKGPMLLNLHCANVLISGCNVSDEEVNKFLSQWTDSESGCGQIGFMILAKDTAKWNFKKALQGLKRFHEPSIEVSHRFGKKLSQLVYAAATHRQSTSYLLLDGAFDIRADFWSPVDVLSRSFEQTLI